jgi:DMSO/TMAO reductase YedYZ molybdopterin-dependent catalytic subunit
MHTPTARKQTRPLGRRVGAVSGLLAAAAGLGVAQLVAALVGGGSPLIAVGGAVVDRTPRWLKEFAIRAFGENDKIVLLAGIAAVIAAAALLAGAAAATQPAAGYAAVFFLATVAGAAASTRPTARGTDVLPAAAGAFTSAVTLWWLLRTARPDAEPAAIDEPAGTRARPNRRAFLVAGTAVAFVAAGGAVTGRLVSGALDAVADSRARLRTLLPGPVSPAPAVPSDAALDVRGSSPLFTANAAFYRVDTALTVPRLAAEDWQLRVHGMVDREVGLNIDDVLGRPLVERDITLTCVSNEVGGPYVDTARWLGLPLADLLGEAGVQPGADQLVSRSVDGMTIGTPTAAVLDGRDALLAIGMNGEPLPPEHGFPARLVVPGLYGYVSATKWVVDLELTTFDAYDPYWVERGWAAEAPIKTASRIDTPRPLQALTSGVAPVAGVAWAQRRGITSVEVRVDGGSWQPARLAAAVGDDVWRQWVWDWDARPGRHSIEVRATDGTGHTQPEKRVPPFPDGATGWHSVVVTVT